LYLDCSTGSSGEIKLTITAKEHDLLVVLGYKVVYHLVCQHHPLLAATSDMGRDVFGWAGCDDYGFCGHSLEFQG
jgi:hypothetical protein